MEIVIHYNPEQSYEEAALLLARRLFAVYDERIDSLALIPVDNEDFDLWLNGSLVHSQRQSGRAPLVSDVRAVMESTVDHEGRADTSVRPYGGSS